MNILHFSLTPIGGGPIQLVKALQKYSDFNVRLVEKLKNPLFEQDLIFSDNFEEILELVNKSDIIHVNNDIFLDSKEFEPINFRKLKENGKIIVQQFRSHPEKIASRTKRSISDVINPENPSIVIAQFQERFYPNSLIVPNIINNNDNIFDTSLTKNNNIDIFYAPTFDRSAWNHRWNTKGRPETVKILNKFKKFNLYIKNNVPFNELMHKKRESKIIIDELITGSYHKAGLEGLCLAKPVLCYLDSRTEKVLREISGSNENPFINVRIEELYHIITKLFKNESILNEIGLNSKKWFDKYWDIKKTIQKYIDLYKTLINNPEKCKRQESLKLSSNKNIFFAITLPDCIYESRKKEKNQIVIFYERLINKIKRKFKNIFK